VTPSTGSLLSFSWAKTKELLFPFHFKRWIKILFIVWLSGHAAGLGGGGNFPARRQVAPPAEQEQAEPVQQPPAQVGQTGVEEGQEFQGIPAGEQQEANQSPHPNPLPEGEGRGEGQQPPLSPAVIVLIMLIAIPLALFFAWLSARFNFIFLDLLINRDVKIGESFRTHKTIGNSYFLWSLVFGLTAISIFLIFALLAALAKVLLWFVIPLFILAFLVFVISGISIIDFVLPAMYQDQIKTMEACKKLLSLKPNWGQIGLYILIKIGLGIVAAIIAFVVVLIVGLAILITGLIIGIPAGLIASAIPFLKPVFVGLGFLALAAGILALILLVGLLTLPIPIFFRVFALSYLFRLFPDYNLLGVNPSESSS
jgi:hypothetical protein